MAELSARVSITETPPSIPSIPGGSTAVFGFVGVAERGPIGDPVSVTSLADYVKHFGGFTGTNDDLANAVHAFYGEGSAKIYVTRTAHYTDTTDPATLAAVRSAADLVTPGAATPAVQDGGIPTFSISSGDTIVFSVDGGGNVTATFTGVAESLKSAAGPFALADTDTLVFTIDGGAAQTVTFLAADPLIGAIGAVTGQEAANVISSQLAGASVWYDGTNVIVQSDTAGSSSSATEAGGTASATLVFAEDTAGSGNVSNIAAVTAAEVETIVEAASFDVTVSEVGGVIRISTVDTGIASTLQIDVSTADAFGFTEGVINTGAASASVSCYTVEGKTHGTYADGIVVTVSAATSGEAARFNISVTDGGVIQGTFPNLSTDSADDRYIIDYVNARSDLIKITDLLVVGAPRPDDSAVTLAGGDDGLTLLDDNDYLGNSSAKGRTGLRTFDLKGDLTTIAIPGRATASVANGMLTYCDVLRVGKEGEVFAVIDVPSGLNRDEVVTYVETTANLINASEQGAVYWPWIKVRNPSKATFGNAKTITIAPSGSICGMIARSDASRNGGVYDAPAGIARGVLKTVLGVEDDAVLDMGTRNIIYPKRINPITTDASNPWLVDGSRTLKSNGSFPSINERRGVNFIKRSIRLGVEFVKHENHTPELQARVRRTLNSFLNAQMRRRAFRSDEEEGAFQVICDETNNTESDIFASRLNVTVLLATAKPTEFVNLTITQDTRGL